MNKTIYWRKLFLFSVFVALSACIAVELGHSPSWMFFQCFCAITLFYCAHWQTYVSGNVFLKYIFTNIILMILSEFDNFVYCKLFNESFNETLVSFA